MQNNPIQNRYDFIALFDVTNGNPNGDPDNGNAPRIDIDTGHGIVTDVCLKRKIRNYVELTKSREPGYRIYIQETAPLNALDNEAYIEFNTDEKKIADLKKKDPGIDEKIRDFMCKNFYDIRTFGAVMTTFVKAHLNAGQVRGPVQLGFARSIDPIVPQSITITRIAITTETDFDKKKTEMGKKDIVPYGLYKVEGYVSAKLAEKTTGFSEDDLNLLWKAITNMFENDRSAARGNMSLRDLIIFKHESALGNAPAYKLFETVEIKKKNPDEQPRKYSDYEVIIHEDRIPEGVELIRNPEG